MSTSGLHLTRSHNKFSVYILLDLTLVLDKAKHFLFLQNSTLSYCPPSLVVTPPLTPKWWNAPGISFQALLYHILEGISLKLISLLPLICWLPSLYLNPNLFSELWDHVLACLLNISMLICDRLLKLSPLKHFLFSPPSLLLSLLLFLVNGTTTHTVVGLVCPISQTGIIPGFFVSLTQHSSIGQFCHLWF